METDQAEEGSEHAAHLRRDPTAGEVDEFQQFEDDEDQSQEAGEQDESFCPDKVLRVGGGEGEHAGVAGEQQRRRLEGDPAEIADRNQPIKVLRSGGFKDFTIYPEIEA